MLRTNTFKVNIIIQKIRAIHWNGSEYFEPINSKHTIYRVFHTLLQGYKPVLGTEGIPVHPSPEALVIRIANFGAVKRMRIRL